MICLPDTLAKVLVLVTWLYIVLLLQPLAIHLLGALGNDVAAFKIQDMLYESFRRKPG